MLAAVIPLHPCQFRERGERLVNGIAAALGVRDVALHALHRERAAHHLDQPAWRREERLAGEGPLDVVSQPMPVEDGVHAALQIIGRRGS